MYYTNMNVVIHMPHKTIHTCKVSKNGSLVPRVLEITVHVTQPIDMA